jgi:hypothetical protein
VSLTDQVRERLLAAQAAKGNALQHSETSFAPYADAYRGELPVARVWLPGDDVEEINRTLDLMTWGLDADALVLSIEGYYSPGGATPYLYLGTPPTELTNAVVVMGCNREGEAEIAIQQFSIHGTDIKWWPTRRHSQLDLALSTMIRQALNGPRAQDDDEIGIIYDLVADTDEERRAVLDFLAVTKVIEEVPGTDGVLISAGTEVRRREVIRTLAQRRQEPKPAPAE